MSTLKEAINNRKQEEAKNRGDLSAFLLEFQLRIQTAINIVKEKENEFNSFMKVATGEVKDLMEELRQKTDEHLSEIKQPNDGNDPTDEHLLELIGSMIPPAIPGETPSDEKLLTLINSIPPKIVKVIERTEVVKEQPIVNNFTKTERVEVAVADKPEVTAAKLNTLDEKVNLTVIRGLKKRLENIDTNIRAVANKRSGSTMRGGGDSILGGNGISVSRTGGRKTITNTSTGGFTTLAATETPNGATVVFTFAAATAQPSFILSDNVWLKAVSAVGTINWTWNSGAKQATLAIPPLDDILGIV